MVVGRRGEDFGRAGGHKLALHAVAMDRAVRDIDEGHAQLVRAVGLDDGIDPGVQLGPMGAARAGATTAGGSAGAAPRAALPGAGAGRSRRRGRRRGGAQPEPARHQPRGRQVRRRGHPRRYAAAGAAAGVRTAGILWSAAAREGTPVLSNGPGRASAWTVPCTLPAETRARATAAAVRSCGRIPAHPPGQGPGARQTVGPAGGARSCSAGPGARRQVTVLPIPSLLIPGAGNGLKDCPKSRLSPQVRWKACVPPKVTGRGGGIKVPEVWTWDPPGASLGPWENLGSAGCRDPAAAYAGCG